MVHTILELLCGVRMEMCINTCFSVRSRYVCSYVIISPIRTVLERYWQGVVMRNLESHVLLGRVYYYLLDSVFTFR